jgi:hypothetical protein
MVFPSLHSFSDELAKIAGFKEELEQKRHKKRVAYHFSPRAGDDRWDKFLRNVQSQSFIDELSKHPKADDKLVQHAQSMHDLSGGETAGKIQSSRLPGRTYEIKRLDPQQELPGFQHKRYGCTCNDWRFKSSVNPGRECKHIRAFRKGAVRAD